MESDDEFLPEEILLLAQEAKKCVIPEKSKKQYDRAYRLFQDWKTKKQCQSNCEKMILAYYADYSKSVSLPTLWSHWAMLKSTLHCYDHVDTPNYREVPKLLKSKSKGYQPEKSKVFEPEHIKRFCDTAPDEVYLATKVSLIKTLNQFNLLKNFKIINYINLGQI